MNRDYTLTEESLRKLKHLVNKDRYQPDRVYHNTRPTDNAGGEWIEFVIVSMDTPSSGPFTGLKVATVTVKGGTIAAETELEVVDHSGGLFDVAGEMTGYTGWAMPSANYLSLEAGAACNTTAPWHWAAINRVCAPNTGLYAEPC